MNAPSDTPELGPLIQAERVRMLYGSSLQVDLVSSVFAIALAVLIGPKLGTTKVGLWAGACLIVSLIRWLMYREYLRSSQPHHSRWLNQMVIMAALMGGVWGLGGAWLMPTDDLNIAAIIVGALIGSSAACTFAFQAHERPNAVLNTLLLLPGTLVLFSRLDAYGLFSGAGLLTLMALMMWEGKRSAQRITELLWLRFSTDRLAQERAQALQLAKRHSAIKDQFLATMSHEMRTPLHGILGLTRMVRQKLPPRPGILAESREHLALIERSGQHLLTIINDVLDFSRIEAGKLDLNPHTFDLHQLLDDVMSLLAVTAQDKGLPLLKDLHLPVQHLRHGDAARLRQVLHNLLGNAIKFTDQGHVTLSVHTQDADWFEFKVEDTGMGIAPDQQALVFEAFHQADNSFGRRHKGSGLGLTISREIARAMGGDIVCESTLGQGSVFTLRLPLPESSAKDIARFMPSRPASLLGDLDAPQFTGHVLLAEDNPVNTLLAKAMLAKLGLKVTHVDNGEQALAALTPPGHGFDLVLMDCQMPILDGIEATRRLRVLERAQGRISLPVIALTANVMSQDRDRCRLAGMDDHLGKPFSQEDLIQKLEAHLHTERGPA